MSLLYGLIMQIRNKLYDTHLLPVHPFSLPVIAIGNLSVGGTGKTPFTIYLANRLLQEVNSLAIVSRGYRRESKGPQLVSDGHGLLLDADQAGDEPLLMAYSVPRAIVVVAERRAEGIELALKSGKPEIILLDDAFQHRAVARDVNILLVNVKEPWKRNLPVPSGTMREFKFNYRRADLIVFTHCSAEDNRPFSPGLPFFCAKAESEVLRDKQFHIRGGLKDLGKKAVAAFAGIAHPEVFFQDLEQRGMDVRYKRAFTDHYRYSKEDIHFLQSMAESKGCHCLLCTEKDLVKIQNLPDMADDPPLLALSLQMRLDHEEDFLDLIRDKIGKRR